MWAECNYCLLCGVCLAARTSFFSSSEPKFYLKFIAVPYTHNASNNLHTIIEMVGIRVAEHSKFRADSSTLILRSKIVRPDDLIWQRRKRNAPNKCQTLHLHELGHPSQTDSKIFVIWKSTGRCKLFIASIPKLNIKITKWASEIKENILKASLVYDFGAIKS